MRRRMHPRTRAARAIARKHTISTIKIEEPSISAMSKAIYGALLATSVVVGDVVELHSRSTMKKDLGKR